MVETNPREEKGKQIALKADLVRVRDYFYKVRSQTSNRLYNVIKSNDVWHCDCPDHKFRKVCCKHIHAVEISIQMRNKVREEQKVIIKPISVSECLFCHGNNIKKFGLRKNKSGDIQRFVCRDCKKTFSINVGFERMRSSPQAITSALQLYFTNESYRSIQKFLRLQGVNVNHTTIHKWIKKYTKLMKEYLDKITPMVGDNWRADEVFVKIKGDQKYLFALMDDETRFWIAQEVADSKFKHDARNLFRLGKKATKTQPKVLITDGLQSYHDAYKKEFRMKDMKKYAVHIRHIRMSGDKNNNKMERLNGEFRDREKVVRGVKKKDSVIFDGYQLFHNFVRPHMSLNGKTPAEMCGIEINGDNKWITIIQNAKIKNIP